ncbi:hypothetical protein ACQP2F_14220 [Actinoplanes sp. CA-030573]
MKIGNASEGATRTGRSLQTGAVRVKTPSAVTSDPRIDDGLLDAGNTV